MRAASAPTQHRGRGQLTHAHGHHVKGGEASVHAAQPVQTEWKADRQQTCRGGGDEQTKMFNGAPAGFEDGGRTAQECYEFARSTWKELAPRWAEKIKPLLEQAVKEW